MGCGVPMLRLRRERMLLVGTRALGDRARAEAWLAAPQPALDGAVPYALAETLEGVQAVVEVLEALAAP
ncbi:MAG: MbcA/ParS/Xre antitoxin family protein [Myxococcaceae bacterium]|nr:MbcA/ParS/Xre antitoxin family protein [Myxococcaceae bacterium]